MMRQHNNSSNIIMITVQYSIGLLVATTILASVLAILLDDTDDEQLSTTPQHDIMFAHHHQDRFLQKDELDDFDNGVVTEDVVALPFVAMTVLHNVLVGIPSAVRNWTGKRMCLAMGTARTCVCNEGQLQEKIAKATRGYNPIRICPNTHIPMTTEIDVTDKTFRILCATTLFTAPDCGLQVDDSTTPTRFFTGAPKDASFQDIVFRNGSADRGGAVLLTGGVFRILRGGFVDNTASIEGGALHVDGNAEVRLLTNTYFTGNEAPTGRDIYVAADADSFVVCKPAGVLVRPQFCDGVEGIAVGGTTTVATSRTNCVKAAYGEFEC